MTQTTATVNTPAPTVSPIRAGVENIRKLAGHYGLATEAEFDDHEATVTITSPSGKYSLVVTLRDDSHVRGELWARGTIRPALVAPVHFGPVLEDLKAS